MLDRNYEGWEGFERGTWVREINLRSFIMVRQEPLRFRGLRSYARKSGGPPYIRPGAYRLRGYAGGWAFPRCGRNYKRILL